jgi:hypothetical protein
VGRGGEKELYRLAPEAPRCPEKGNPALPPEPLALAILELTRDRSLMLPVQDNREIY